VVQNDPNRSIIDRRAWLGGLAAAGLGLPAAARDLQDPAPSASQALTVNIQTRMAARVRINGRPAVFVLDTGAERTSVAADLAERMGLVGGPDMLVHGVTSARTSSTVRIGRIEFGGRTFRDLTTPVFPRNSLAADGLVGLDLLSQFELRLDLVRRVVWLRPGGQGVFVTGQPTRFSVDRAAQTGRFGQLILLNVEVGGQPVAAFVDSGAQYSIGNAALLAQAGSGLSPGTIAVHGVTGQTVEARLGRIPELKVAGRSLGEIPLLFADLHAFSALGLSERPAILLGADVLYRFERVTLNYARGRVDFGPVRPFFAPPLATG
jgi:predicted aspartyl protease